MHVFCPIAVLRRDSGRALARRGHNRKRANGEERKEGRGIFVSGGRKNGLGKRAGKQAGWSGLRVKVEVPSRRAREPEGTDGRVDQPQLRGSRTQPLYFPHIGDLSGYWLGWRQSNALQRCVKSFLHV